MCFNSTSSLIAFSISVLCFIYLLVNGLTTNNKYDIFASLTTILIGSMQLIEYFLWKSQDCSYTNQIFSLLIICVLFLQGGLGSLLFINLFKSPRIFNNIILFINTIYLFFIIYLLYWLSSKKLCSRPTENSCRLAWAPYEVLLKNPYGRILLIIHLCFYFFIGTFMFGYFDIIVNGKIFEGIKKYPIRYTIIPFTFILCLVYLFITDGMNFIDVFGSMWCFIAVIYGIISCLHI